MGVLLTTLAVGAKADVDPNFYIYLCFGQSNMEGNAQPQSVDKQYVDPRFQMLATTNFNSPKRTMGEWYTATCPIVSPWGGLGMADYFGRTMVAALPSNVRVGVVDVAIGGIAIEGFMSDKIGDLLKSADGWQKEFLPVYQAPFRFQKWKSLWKSSSSESSPCILYIEADKHRQSLPAACSFLMLLSCTRR